MKTAVVVAVAAAFGVALLAAGAARAAGTVQVSFVQPEKFADVRDRAHSSEQALEALEKVLMEAAAPHVADGQTLKLEVLDVDLAGETRPGSRIFDTRVMRGRADWPRITLRWSLAGGAAPRSGEAVVQDMAYLQRLAPPQSGNYLAHERRMLDEWFRAQFSAH